ncbi:hypothetical protein H6H01_23145 [Nostoc calcicola FACHB-3891]|nr:hypothetical protein [Nostoc calcicola FACHB-3891]
MVQIDRKLLSVTEPYWIMDNCDRYKKIERVNDVPWFMIAVIHQLEASANFNTQRNIQQIASW